MQTCWDSPSKLEHVFGSSGKQIVCDALPHLLCLLFRVFVCFHSQPPTLLLSRSSQTSTNSTGIDNVASATSSYSLRSFFSSLQLAETPPTIVIMAAASSQIVAFFSTNGGKRAPRHLKDPKPQVLCRSDRERDLKEYVRQLRESYPHVCSSIFSLSNNGKHFEPRWFFDEYDFHVQGGQFLYDVISAIIAENQEKLVRFCKEWSEANKKNHGVELLGDVRKTFDFYFHQKDQEELGNGFLASAVEYMREAYWNAKTEQSDELHEVKEPKGV